MKRRSARPFVVEVKSTRSSRAAIKISSIRDPASRNLWQGLSLEDHPPSPAPEQSRRIVEGDKPPMRDAEPQRRILQALTPNDLPTEPEFPVPAKTAKPRRDSGERVQRKPRADASLESEATVVVPAVEAAALPLVRGDQEAPFAGVPESSRSADESRPRSDRRRGLQHPELNRGERWKRRLPRSCW